MSAAPSHLDELLSVLARAAGDLRDVGAVGVITGVAVIDGADVLLRCRAQAAPMHLVMATAALAGEAEDAIRRAGGPHARKLAALAVARSALKQAME